MSEEQLLLRALRDVNVPKFLKDDIPLFDNIISDLFPGVDRPIYEYGHLQGAIKKKCDSFDEKLIPNQLLLQPSPVFMGKVL